MTRQPAQAEMLGPRCGVLLLTRSIMKEAGPLKTAPSHSAAGLGQRRAHIMHSTLVYLGEELGMDDS